MEKLTRFSVNYPVSVLMIVLGIVLLGYISFSKLGVDLFPDMNNPKIYVELLSGERPPEEIEKQFVDQIETVCLRQSDVVEVSSVCRTGKAIITISYTWEKDMDEAFLDLQKALNGYATDEDIDELNISQFSPNESPIMLVGLTHESIKNMNELRKVAENYIRNELIRLEGIADVQLVGKEVDELRIDTKQYLLEAHGVSIDDISAKISAFNKTVSGGSIEEMGLKYTVKGINLFTQVEDFENIVITYKTDELTNAKTPVFLRDLAQVSFATAEVENIARLNGEQCIGLAIYKEPKYNTVKAQEALSKSFEKIQKALPGYQFEVIQNQGVFINDAISEVKDSAVSGIILAIIILYVFLRRVGVTVIISVAIPVSVIATFNLMYFNGLTLNIMTLGGLALGAGMLVDNAIVVVENIFRKMEKGLSVREASIQGTAEMGGAITASTLTTIVVFLPIVYLQGASGELFKDQAWTVAFSLLSSLFVAILVIPMLVSKFFNEKDVATLTPEEEHKPLELDAYGRFLQGILNYKWGVIAFSAVLVLGAYLLLPFIGSEYFPKTSGKSFTLEMNLSDNTSLKQTSKTVQKIEKLIGGLYGSQVKTIYSQSGPSTTEDDATIAKMEGENTAYITVILSDSATISLTHAMGRLEQALNQMEEVEMRFVQDDATMQSVLGTDESPISIDVIGKDLDEIVAVTEIVKTELAKVEAIFNVETSVEGGSPELEVTVDRLQAGLYNLSVDGITKEVKNQLDGHEVGSFEHEGEMKDIQIKLPQMSLKDLENIKISTGNDDVRLTEVTKINFKTSPKAILRENQNRIGRVSAQIQGDIPLDQMIVKVKEAMKKVELPTGIKLAYGGEEAQRAEAMSGLSFALILSIVLVYMVMASQFESLVHPFTILLTIPLAVVGSVFAFFLFGKAFSLMAFIGLIMLAGISVNGSIILVDTINQQKKKGTDLREGIIFASQQRLRPILMTSLTTILALLPMLFGFGSGAELRMPMALAVVGGLITSTLLTLVVIPCFYEVIENGFQKVRKMIA